MRGYIFLGFFSALVLIHNARADTSVYTNAHIFPGDGAPVIDGSMIVRDGKIVATGKNVPLPVGARIIDLEGKIVTPGFISADTSLGLVEVPSVGGTNDTRGGTSRLSAGVDVQYALNSDSNYIDLAREGGVTSAIVLPEVRTGDDVIVFGGQAASIKTVRGLAILSHAKVGVTLDLGEAGVATGGSSRAADMVLVRSALDDVKLYMKKRAAYEIGKFRPLTFSREDLDALVPVLERKIPLIVSAHRASDILQAVNLVKEYKLKIVIRGGEEAWRVAKILADADIGVIVTPTSDLPETFEKLGATMKNAGLLAKAGVKIAIIGNDKTQSVRELRYNVGMASARGLPLSKALDTVTINPAKMFGLDKTVGSLVKGKDADFVVWSGDPFEPLSQALSVYIAGVEQPLLSRARALALRYSGFSQ